jgi:hypothetical protein
MKLLTFRSPRRIAALGSCRPRNHVEEQPTAPAPHHACGATVPEPSSINRKPRPMSRGFRFLRGLYFDAFLAPGSGACVR